MSPRTTTTTGPHLDTTIADRNGLHMLGMNKVGRMQHHHARQKKYELQKSSSPIIVCGIGLLLCVVISKIKRLRKRCDHGY